MPHGLKIIVIVGPTASGKSDLAIALAQKLHGEIISADSRQVYRGMDIGTGKVTRDKRKVKSKRKEEIPTSRFSLSPFYSQGVLHHLLDVADPKRDFSVTRFQSLGREAIKKIVSGPDSERIEDPRFAGRAKREANRDNLPIIAGGTGLYVDSLVFNTQFPEVKANKKLRAKLEKQSAEQLFKKLQKLDPQRAKAIDWHNKRRLVRALEIVIVTGKPVPSLHKESPYHVLWLGITLPKEKLEKRIAIRLTKRLKQGMIAEVRRLHNQGVSWKRLESFGLEYRWIAQYLQKKISLQDMKSGLLVAIIQYTKRQMTWFKRNQNIHWLQTKSQALSLARKFVY